MSVWIGTSGWVYKEWAGHFYPKGWPKKDEFSYYARHFPTVEINATFYRLPTKKMVQGWHERSPQGFVFAVKGSRYLTHIRRLRDTGPGLRKYFSRLEPLGDRTGPILWQLPPNFRKDDENRACLERFLQKLPKQYQHAVEFRHPSWMDEDTFGLLREHRVCNVWISSLRMPADHAITGDFVYLRFHGLKDGAYHDYTDDELEPWARVLAKAAERDIPAYVYFNNDLNTRAPLNAESLMRQIGGHAVQPLGPERGEKRDIAPAVKGPESWRPWTRTRRSASRTSSTSGGRRSPPAATRRGRAKAQKATTTTATQLPSAPRRRRTAASA